jgi:Alpha/beta hydrolase domain
VLSETDVRTPTGRRPDSDVFRRWEVAGVAHSGYAGHVYRAPLSERDLGGITQYNCANPPFSSVPLGHVVSAAYDHLAAWVANGTPPPHAPTSSPTPTEPKPATNSASPKAASNSHRSPCPPR